MKVSYQRSRLNTAAPEVPVLLLVAADWRNYIVIKREAES